MSKKELKREIDRLRLELDELRKEVDSIPRQQFFPYYPYNPAPNTSPDLGPYYPQISPNTTWI